MPQFADHLGWFWIGSMLLAYASGSIPMGVMIATRKGVDIRAAGSGNPGATNVGRVLGRRFGILCFCLDALKGATPVLLSGGIAGVLGQGAAGLTPVVSWSWLAVACAAILGHCFSPFLGFRGGKGVATGFGSVLAMWPIMTIPAIAAFVVWALVLGLTRLMSLASIVGALVLPATVLAMTLGLESRGSWSGAVPFLIVTSLIAAFVVFRHRDNIRRLRAGAETRVGGDS